MELVDTCFVFGGNCASELYFFLWATYYNCDCIVMCLTMYVYVYRFCVDVVKLTICEEKINANLV